MSDLLTVQQRIRLKQIIDRRLDGLYTRASELGKQMGAAFGSEAKSQLRNLESIASAATRTSALKNHVKNQTGKDKGKETWADGEAGESLGERVLQLLDDLVGVSLEVVEELKHDGAEEERRELARTVELELQRGLVQTAVCSALWHGKNPS